MLASEAKSAHEERFLLAHENSLSRVAALGTPTLDASSAALVRNDSERQR
jgi:hypothetical protein